MAVDGSSWQFIVVLGSPPSVVCEAACRSPRQSAAVLDSPRQSLAVLDSPWQSLAASRSPRQSAAFLGSPRQSVAVSGNQRRLIGNQAAIGDQGAGSDRQVSRGQAGVK